MSQDHTDDPGPTAESPTRTQDGDGAYTEEMPGGLLAAGQVLGERYQILEMLGRGGMGEVWRAFDLKLRVELALKALRSEFFNSERRLEMLRQEVRAAREVLSPNVCRIFDLIEADGSELVSMEYVDGQTLLQVLQERGPLELKEAQDLASQFLAGLEAIHKVGLVHRDVKPENIMLTRAGRVVLMDFSLARQEESGAGTVAGTPAYMAPEQAAGLKVDARADVYSAGVVLAEMVSPDGIKSFESRQSIWEGVRSEPAKLPDTPWAPVLEKAVAKEADNRYKSAHTLTRALEDVTLRVEGADDLNPYPGAGGIHRAGLRVLLRPGSRGGTAVAAVGPAPSARSRRPLGLWQNLVPQSRLDPECSCRLGDRALHTRRHGPRLCAKGASIRDFGRFGRGGRAGGRGRRRHGVGLLAVAEAPRPGTADHGSVRGVVHPQ